MAILPGYDYQIFELFFDKEQTIWLAVSQYVIAALIVTALAFWVVNFVKIIVKQGKYKVLPLSTFYALALPLLILRFYLDIWFFTSNLNPMFTIIFAPPTMKFLIAVNQAWVNIELCLSIRVAIKSSVAPKISNSEHEPMPAMKISASQIAQRRKQMKMIEVGRICDVVFIAAFLFV